MTVEHISRDQIRELQQLSPFELKNTLQQLAGEHERRTAFQQLNAGRGNPNFTAPTPREAFFRLGQWAVEECRADVEWDHELVGIPQQEGIAERLRTWLGQHAGQTGVDLLTRLLDLGTGTYGFEPDAFVWELADSVIGDHYPDPPRMLVHAEKVVRHYLEQEMGSGLADGEGFDLFATEGGTAAMCYLFESLQLNHLVVPGDKVAVMAPIFNPYIEILSLDQFGLDQVELRATTTFPDGELSWQYTDEEIDRLRDPAIKALFCVNPTNPPSVRLADETLERIADVVATDNPGLVIITDDVYGTFAQSFTSLASSVPRNTVLVYSFSKYFGATGWRLGVIGLHHDNVLDQHLGELSEDVKKSLDKRYGSLTLAPRDLRFIDRLVADSREVALNHTAGLSSVQQVQMLLFAAYCLLDKDDHYKQQAQGLIGRRLGDLIDGMQTTMPDDPLRVGYYIEIDFKQYALAQFGQEFFDYLEKSYEPTDILFRLAEQTGIVALNGGGFEGPEWSIRLSIANLRDVQYEQIGKTLRAVANQYVDEWHAAQQAGTAPASQDGAGASGASGASGAAGGPTPTS